MLGELVLEASGKLIGLRVLDENATMEMTTQEQGTIFGSECSTTMTFVGTPRPDGTVYVEGYGMTLTKEGDAATLTSSGIMIPKGPMPVSSIRGATFFRTQSPKLARLNSVVCIYEVEVNEDWSFKTKDWEWK
jgi:hypothetical protein